MNNLKVSDVMSKNPVIISGKSSLQEASEMMKAVDCGFLPVGTADRIEGVITDRDIIVNAIAENKTPSEEQVKDYMTVAAYGCNEDDFLEDAAKKMKDHKVSRLIVRNHGGEVVGILSFGSILRYEAKTDDITNVVKHVLYKAVA